MKLTTCHTSGPHAAPLSHRPLLTLWVVEEAVPEAVRLAARGAVVAQLVVGVGDPEGRGFGVGVEQRVAGAREDDEVALNQVARLNAVLQQQQREGDSR